MDVELAISKIVYMIAIKCQHYIYVLEVKLSNGAMSDTHRRNDNPKLQPHNFNYK